jgi:hypothetical protein
MKCFAIFLYLCVLNLCVFSEEKPQKFFRDYNIVDPKSFDIKLKKKNETEIIEVSKIRPNGVDKMIEIDSVLGTKVIGIIDIKEFDDSLAVIVDLKKSFAFIEYSKALNRWDKKQEYLFCKNSDMLSEKLSKCEISAKNKVRLYFLSKKQYFGETLPDRRSREFGILEKDELKIDFEFLPEGKVMREGEEYDYGEDFDSIDELPHGSYSYNGSTELSVFSSVDLKKYKVRIRKKNGLIKNEIYRITPTVPEKIIEIDNILGVKFFKIVDVKEYENSLVVVAELGKTFAYLEFAKEPTGWEKKKEHMFCHHSLLLNTKLIMGEIVSKNKVCLYFLKKNERFGHIREDGSWRQKGKVEKDDLKVFFEFLDDGKIFRNDKEYGKVNGKFFNAKDEVPIEAYEVIEKK